MSVITPDPRAKKINNEFKSLETNIFTKYTIKGITIYREGSREGEPIQEIEDKNFWNKCIEKMGSCKGGACEL